MITKLEIFKAQSGNYSARVRLGNNTIRHLHSTVKPEEESKYYQDLELWGNIIIFAGLGFGYHIREKMKSIPSSSLIIVLDYFSEFLDTCLSTIFKTCNCRILTLSANSQEDTWNTIQESINTIPDPFYQVIKHPASYNIDKEFYDSAINTICQPRRQNTLTRKRGLKPLLFYGTFFLQEEIRRAFTKIKGKDICRYEYKKIPHAISYESTMQKIIQTEKPDFLFTVNMKGFDRNGVILEKLAQFDIPVVIWFVDDPHPILLPYRHYINNNMYALCWEKAYLPYLRKCGFQKVDYLPLATDISLFNQKVTSRSHYPLGFVGSSMGMDFLQAMRERFLWHASLDPLVKKAVTKVLAQPQRKIPLVINELCRELKYQLPFADEKNLTWFSSYIFHSASMEKRIQIIKSLIPYGIRTFGDQQGWQNLFGDTIRTHSDIDYNTQLATIYNSIQVNINITSCQMPSAVNQRVFDIPMSGSLIINDNQGDIAELFELGKETVVYHDITELKELITFYQNHEDSRKSIITNARNRIIKDHTYENRLRTLLKKIF